MATTASYAQSWTARGSTSPGSNKLAAGPDVGAVLTVGFGLLLLDTFITVSRSLEILGLDFGLSLPYVAIAIHALAFAFAFLTGGARRLATSRTGISLILFTGWMMACTPFSSWRTGSARTILFNWVPSLVGFLAIGLLSSLRQCRRFGSTLALSGLTIAVASLLLGTYKAQRLSFNSGTLSNANDLAMLLLMAAPFCLIPLFDPASNRAIKFLAPVGGMLVLAVNLRTGSRASLVAILAIVLTLFLTCSLLGKLNLAAAIVVMATVLVAVIPSYSLDRYATIFNEPDSIQDYRSETYGSSELRKELLLESAMATLQHPLFGVGPGVYAPAMAKEAERQGKFALWRVSHNTYTQVSSEMGFPGLMFYLAAIVYAYLDVLWVRKHSRNDPSTNALALCLLLSLVGLSVNFFFGSYAYMAWLPILVGLGAALRMNLQQDLYQRASAAMPAAAKIPAPRGMAPSPSMPAPVPHPAPAPARSYRFLGRRRRIQR